MSNSTLALTTLALTALTAPLFAQDQSAKVSFANGDKMSGAIIKMGGDHLEFSSPHFPENVLFNKSAILDVDLSSTEPSIDIDALQADHVAHISLKSRFGYDNEHGLLKGQLKQLNDDSIVLSTWYAGDLTVDKSLVKSVEVFSNNSILYAGPNSMQEWSINGESNAWRYADNALISSSIRGAIAKDINMPEKAHLSFDLEWKSNIGLTLFLFANSDDESPTNYYELRLQTGYMYMRKQLKGERPPQLDRMPNSNHSYQTRRAKFDVYADKVKGKFHVYIDGQKAHTFTDHAATPKKLGSALHLRNDSGNKMRLSQLKLSNWNGSLHNEADQKAYDELEGEGQKILMANGDAVIGKVGKIENGMLEVETTYTPVKIPLFGIRDIEITSAIENGPKAEANDIKAYYRDGGWVIIEVDHIDGEFIHGENKAVGKQSFRLDAFEKFELNIYDAELNKTRKHSEW